MTSRAWLWCALAFLTAGVALGALSTGALPVDLGGVDAAWNSLMGRVRTPALVRIATAFNTVGGGWVATLLIPLAIGAALLLTRRWRFAVFALVSFILSTLAVQVLKHLFGRARPSEMLVMSDYGSFPSGHTANAATIAVVAVVIVPRLWVALVGVAWVVAMALSRTLLSVHWLTDTVGGALVGASVAMLLAVLLARWLRPHRPIRSPRAAAGSAGKPE